MAGSVGADTLYGGLGNDLLQLSGNDVVQFGKADGNDVLVSDGSGVSQIRFTDSAQSEWDMQAVGNDLVIQRRSGGNASLTLTGWYGGGNWSGQTVFQFTDGLYSAPWQGSNADVDLFLLWDLEEELVRRQKTG